jgi:hypothetical protein
VVFVLSPCLAIEGTFKRKAVPLRDVTAEEAASINAVICEQSIMQIISRSEIFAVYQSGRFFYSDDLKRHWKAQALQASNP